MIIQGWNFVLILERTHEIQTRISVLKAGHQHKVLKWNQFQPQYRLKGTFPITQGRRTHSFLEDVFMISWRKRRLLPWFLVTPYEKKKILYVCLRWLFLFLECFFQTLDSILGIETEFQVVAQKLHLHPLFSVTATWQPVSFVRESNFLCVAQAQWTPVGLALTSAGTAQWESNYKTI